jgi:hypothetical protein
MASGTRSGSGRDVFDAGVDAVFDQSLFEFRDSRYSFTVRETSDEAEPVTSEMRVLQDGTKDRIVTQVPSVPVIVNSPAFSLATVKNHVSGY